MGEIKRQKEGNTRETPYNHNNISSVLNESSSYFIYICLVVMIVIIYVYNICMEFKKKKIIKYKSTYYYIGFI